MAKPYDYRDPKIYEFTQCQLCIYFRKATKIHNYRCNQCDLSVISNLDVKIAAAIRKYDEVTYGTILVMSVLGMVVWAIFMLVHK